MLRDASSYGTYFLVYEQVRKFMYHRLDGKFGGADALSSFIGGGAAGAISWTQIYPVDIVKARIQQDSVINPQWKSIWHCFTTSVKEEGYGILIKGYANHIVAIIHQSG